MKFLSLFAYLVCCSLLQAQQTSRTWQLWSPRPETTPNATQTVDGSLVIETGEGDHWIGAWTQSVPVKGGSHHRFHAWVKHSSMPLPRRSVYARICWQDEKGRPVNWEVPARQGYAKGSIPRAEPEYPAMPETALDQWAECETVLLAPVAARQAKMELYLQWAPNTRVEWKDISLTETTPPPPRKVRLAAVHFLPAQGKTPAEKPPQYTPFIEEAARQKADLVVLGETLTYYGTGKSMAECAEPIPGPSTRFFATQAKKHGLYIVAGLVERDGQAIYNTAVVLGPDGTLVGRYRKVTLPRSEIEAGVQPGHEYPVFNTRFGKLGVMICYDGFFPEVARALTVQGAEVIAWPVWGCNPLLAQARACENHVYIVSSTYTDPSKHSWMISGIFDHYGDIVCQAKEWGTLAIAEVDLQSPAHWNSLGDFKAQLPSHRPVALPEPGTIKTR